MIPRPHPGSPYEVSRRPLVTGQQTDPRQLCFSFVVEVELQSAEWRGPSASIRAYALKQLTMVPNTLSTRPDGLKFTDARALLQP